MRKKVQYIIAFSNLILQILTFAVFRSPSKHLFFGFEHELLTRVLAAFILLMPVVFVLMGNMIERNERNTGVYSYKVFPVIFIILLLSSWIMCVYVNAVLGFFKAEMQNWILLFIGAAVMYLSNFATAVKKDNAVFKKLGIKIKNEYVFKKTLRMSLYAFGLEGYVIMLSGAAGFFFNRKISLTLALSSVAGFAIAVICVYFIYTGKIRKSKKLKNTVAKT